MTLPGYQHPIFVRADTSDAEVFVKIFAACEYESDLTDPRVIIDLGANVGYASVYFAQTFPNSHIVAVEPDASNFAQLKKNIGPYANITAVQSAVWPTQDKIRISNPDAEKWLFQIEAAAEDGEGTLVEAVTIPELRALCGDRPIDILKIDIESAEKELFATNYEPWLDKVNLLIIELHDSLKGGCAKSFFSAIVHYDFHQWIRGENMFVEFIRS